MFLRPADIEIVDLKNNYKTESMIFFYKYLNFI
jgi:hypothetical protein